MNKKNLIAFSILLLLSTETFGQQKDKKDDIDIRLTKCLDKPEGQTTVGMCDCTYAALDEWDKKLNVTYKSLMASLSAEAKIKLKDAQKQWIVFRDKEVQLIGASIGAKDGTMWRIVAAEKHMNITRERALELENLLEIMKG